MLLDLEEKTRVLVEDIVERSAIGRGAIFVLGLSSSEVAGGTIGKALIEIVADDGKAKLRHLQNCF